MTSPHPRLRTAPVLCVLVCHDGDQWLSTALSALRRQRIRPRHVIAVDTGSHDRTATVLAQAGLAEAEDLLDGVLTAPRGTGFGTAVRLAVEHAVERWGDPGKWLWLLHDDSAPEPDCLAALLTAAEVSPSAAVLGPLCLDWVDSRLVVEAGLSTDSSGHRQTGLSSAEHSASFQQSTEVLAVSSAGSLIRREVWHELGGYDEAMPLLRDDLDFGWRANRSGHLVLCVPVARMRHARAATKGARRLDAAMARPGPSFRGVDRAHGMRTFLVNTSGFSFLIGLPRLLFLSLLRALGFLLLRRFADAHAEVGAARYLLTRGRLFEGRRARRGSAVVRGLFTSRLTRFRNAVRAGATFLIRRRVEADAALGRLPASDARSAWLEPSEVDTRPVGPSALPAGAARGRPRVAGLRRPPIVVPVDAAWPGALRPSPRPRPSPGPRGPDMVFVEVDQSRVLRSLLLAPPVLLVLSLSVVAVIANWARLGLDLAGGRLLPVGSLGSVWSAYLASWHPVFGGTAAPAPAALAVLGLIPGGPSFAVAMLLLGDIPLAALSAYIASRGMRVRRSVRAVVAAFYGLLPVATTAVSEGRLDVVVVHIVTPVVFAGVYAVLRASSTHAWLPMASGTALGVAVLGAFSPLTHVVTIVGALAGFIAVSGGARRIAALFAIVLLPMALLLPWPAVLLQHPEMVLNGLGATFSSPPPNLIVCSVFVAAAFAAAVLRPNASMLPGLLVIVLAIAALAAVAAVKAWPGTPLVILAWGLVCVVLAGCQRGVAPGIAGQARVRRAVYLVGVVTLVSLGVAGLLDLRGGPLKADGGVRLSSSLTAELERTGRSVLILGSPVRQVAGRMPAFGDDDLVPTVSSPARLRRWNSSLLDGAGPVVTLALAQAASSGVSFLVLPSEEAAARVRAAGGELVSVAPAASDGRPVLRLRLAADTGVLLGPDLARRARTGGEPPVELAAAGVAPVNVSLPEVAVRVSAGGDGRVLVLAAEDEPGWVVSVDGVQVPVVRAWGHLVGVPLPGDAAEVRVEMSTTLRDFLLLAQAAAALFTVLTAIPSRRRG
ncbi:glycosyltransferase [Lentzea aerocolonigenes]|uniref:Glycosyltransferase n=1 Tax=Lentzea aerocolonigenes TaxID=68170 RepID=A0A0F0GR40_LENAE|nr:glycosyltransferase family 2 protein [Lentzea aerocolonigenes]KJK43888.1 glycosyltransferase [Lentzea aerocolonigenes]